MSAFVCVKCAQDGREALVRYRSDQFVIEVAAKRADGQERAAQVSTHRFCQRHAEEYIESIRLAWGRNALHVEQFTGQESLL